MQEPGCVSPRNIGEPFRTYQREGAPDLPGRSPGHRPANLPVGSSCKLAAQPLAPHPRLLVRWRTIVLAKVSAVVRSTSEPLEGCPEGIAKKIATKRLVHKYGFRRGARFLGNFRGTSPLRGALSFARSKGARTDSFQHLVPRIFELIVLSNKPGSNSYLTERSGF